MNVSIHILLKFATSKTGRNVIGGILLFIVTVLELLATLMACMASFVVAQFSDQFHPPMPHNTVISSSFTIGRKNPVTGEVENHYGTDFPAPEGTVIVASSAGTVKSKWSNSVEGNVVRLIHSNGWTTTYKHCVDTSLVEVGEEVVQGQPIALCGSEGQSTGSHCHFELRIDGVAIDAETVLQPWPEDKLKLSDEMVESYWQSKGVFLCLAGGL